MTDDFVFMPMVENNYENMVKLLEVMVNTQNKESLAIATTLLNSLMKRELLIIDAEIDELIVKNNRGKIKTINNNNKK